MLIFDYVDSDKSHLLEEYEIGDKWICKIGNPNILIE